MELTAAIKALEVLNRRCKVEFYTDFAVPSERDHQLDQGLEAKWLEDR